MSGKPTSGSRTDDPLDIATLQRARDMLNSAEAEGGIHAHYTREDFERVYGFKVADHVKPGTVFHDDDGNTLTIY